MMTPDILDGIYRSLLESTEMRDIDELASMVAEAKLQTGGGTIGRGAATETIDGRDSRSEGDDAPRLGSEYVRLSKGSRALLRIVLKVCDELELIVPWIEYHAKCVGYENLVVVDCGSNDPAFLDILRQYSEKLVCLKYARYYDSLHDLRSNAALWTILGHGCEFVAILDADEFLCGVHDGCVSVSNLKDILVQYPGEVLAGTWFQNSDPIPVPEHCSEERIRFNADSNWISWGTSAGKAIIRTSALRKFAHLGHNSESSLRASTGTTESFGKIVVLHINRLAEPVVRRRVLRHLRSKGVVPAESKTDDAIRSLLKAKIDEASLVGVNLMYARKYIEPTASIPSSERHVLLSLRELIAEKVPLSSGWDDYRNFDFASLMQPR